MKSRLLLAGLIVLLGFKAMGQTGEDVNVIIAPTAGYNWFDKKTTVEDALMYGIQAGFGFGKVMEFRGVYERSSNSLGQKFGKYSHDIQDFLNDYEFAHRDVKVTRVGGEIKANLPISKTLDPYFLVGTGIQTFERKFEDIGKYETENIYATGGLGLKFNISRRVTFNLEGRTYIFNMNPQNMLIDPEHINTTNDPSFGEWLRGHDSRRMVNWSVNAGLQFYLNGVNDKDLSDLDKAYLRRFSSGLSKFKVTLAPIGGYMDFDRKTGYRDTYMLGGELGVDFSDFFGIRGYYMRATEDEKIDLDFDKMSVYGGDFVGKLNVARGIVPYITLGTGYLDVHDGYQPDENDLAAPSKLFVKGGLGLDIPLSTRLDLFGAANLIYTTDSETSDVTTIESTDQLKKHSMFNAGLRFKLGKKVDTQRAVDRSFDERFSPERRAFEDSISRYDERVSQYKGKVQEYDERVKELEEELKEAYDQDDVERVTEIMEEKRNMTEELQKSRPVNDTLIRMTPKEFESLIDKVLRGVGEEELGKDETSLEGRLDRLEELLLNIQTTTPQPASIEPRAVQPAADSGAVDTSANDRLIEEIGKLQKRIDEQQATIQNMNQQNTRALEEAKESRKEARERGQNTTGNLFLDHERTSTLDGSGFIYNRGMSVHVGPNFGDASGFNIGARWYRQFSNTSIVFMPEAYFSLGSGSGFGVSANGIIPFNFARAERFSPYAGVGVGVNYLDSDFTFNPNFIVGTSYSVGKGSLFIDFTARGAFKYNQLALGYRFRF